MRTYGRDRLVWRPGYHIECEGKFYCSVIPVEGNEKMYKVGWPDGIVSKDYYNLTRAKDHAVKETLKLLNNIVEDEL